MNLAHDATSTIWLVQEITLIEWASEILLSSSSLRLQIHGPRWSQTLILYLESIYGYRGGKHFLFSFAWVGNGSKFEKWIKNVCGWFAIFRKYNHFTRRTILLTLNRIASYRCQPPQIGRRWATAIWIARFRLSDTTAQIHGLAIISRIPKMCPANRRHRENERESMRTYICWWFAIPRVHASPWSSEWMHFLRLHFCWNSNGLEAN